MLYIPSAIPFSTQTAVAAGHEEDYNQQEQEAVLDLELQHFVSQPTILY
jgi:hypothetical protein